ncbi:MAG: 30S ribosomal protein S6 [Candidatus Nomurabacteria bacterium]|nr:30S ribosomal protein S6 [Candidatus Nomurabacteria bacterium]
MNEYELTVLVEPDSEDAAKEALASVEKVIAGAKGKVVSDDDWGKKRLEYKIKNQTHAIYHFYVLKLDGAAVGKIDQALNITDGVLRHLIVKVDAKKKALIAAVESKKAKEE